MIELETVLMPKLSKYITPWTRYFDDTITSIKPGCILKAIIILASMKT